MYRMEMARPQMLTVIACLAISVFCRVAECSDEQPSTYEILEHYGFPKGLLPTNVKGHALNQDGSFEVYLNESCSFGIEAGYRLSYQRKISGMIKPGSLKNLRGISVKVMFVWLGITGIELQEGQLAFYVGVLSASFPLSNFYECPSCGCGLDCADRPLLVSES